MTPSVRGMKNPGTDALQKILHCVQNDILKLTAKNVYLL